MLPVASGNKPASLSALRRRLAVLAPFSARRSTASGVDGSDIGASVGSRPSDNKSEATAIPFGIQAMDDHLPWGGLPRAALHEIIAASEPAAAGFAAVLLGRLARVSGRAVVWCRRPARGFRPALYGAGLKHFGLASNALIIVQGADHQAILWTMEECLRSRAIAVVLGEVDRADGRALRRLQLAAEKTNVTALLLRPNDAPSVPGPVTRWRISTAPNAQWPKSLARGESNCAAWRVELLKCRGGGQPGAWDLAWNARDDLFKTPDNLDKTAQS